MVYVQLAHLTILYMYFWYTVVVELYCLCKCILTLVAFLYTASWLVDQWESWKEFMNRPEPLPLEDRVFRTTRTRNERLAKTFHERRSPPRVRQPTPSKRAGIRLVNQSCHSDRCCLHGDQQCRRSLVNSSSETEEESPRTWQTYMEREGAHLNDSAVDLAMEPKCPLPCDDYNHLTDEQRNELLNQLHRLKAACTDDTPRVESTKRDTNNSPPSTNRHHKFIKESRQSTKRKVVDLNKQIVALFH